MKMETIGPKHLFLTHQKTKTQEIIDLILRPDEAAKAPMGKELSPLPDSKTTENAIIPQEADSLGGKKVERNGVINPSILPSNQGEKNENKMSVRATPSSNSAKDVVAGKNRGWVKLHRAQFSHEISEEKPWCDGYAWSYLYAMANHKPGVVSFRSQYIPIERGQFITSMLRLCAIFGWGKRRLKSFLQSLKNRGMCAYRSTNRFLVLTICNYEKYQGREEEREPTEEQTEKYGGEHQEMGGSEPTEEPTGGKQVSINNNGNNGKKERIRKEIIKEKYGQFKNVLLTTEEKLKVSDEEIENLSEYLESKGKKYKSHYATILIWRRKKIGTDQRNHGGPYRESKGKSSKYAHLTTVVRTHEGDSEPKENA